LLVMNLINLTELSVILHGAQCIEHAVAVNVDYIPEYMQSSALSKGSSEVRLHVCGSPHPQFAHH